MDGSCRGLQSGRARGGPGRLSAGSSPRRTFASYAPVRRASRGSVSPRREASGCRADRETQPQRICARQVAGPWRRTCPGPVGPPAITAAPGLGCEPAASLMVTRLYADLKSPCLRMNQRLHGATSVVLQEAGIRSEVGVGGEGRKVRRALGPWKGRASVCAGQAAATQPLAPAESLCLVASVSSSSHSSCPAPEAGGPDTHLDPGLQGGPGHSPPQPPGIAPHLAEASRPSRAPSRMAPPGWTSALTRAPVPSQVCDARDTGAGSVPLQFCPEAMVASTCWSTSPGEVPGAWRCGGSGLLGPEILGVTVTPQSPTSPCPPGPP